MVPRALSIFLAALPVATCASTQVTVSVDGPGCLRFVHEGRVVYAKRAVLTVGEGRLASAAGQKVVPAIAVPAAGSLTVDLDGTVVADGAPVGRLVLALFAKEPSCDATFSSSPERPTLANPGEGEAGVVRCSGSEPSVRQKAVPKGDAKRVQPEGKPQKTGGEPAKDGRVRIVLSALTEVESAQFSIAQIASITAPDALLAKIEPLPIGDTPPFGIERVVDHARVLMRLKAAGIDLTKVDLGGPPKARVVRKGQSVTHDQFVQAAIAGASAKGLGQAFEPATPGPTMTVPLGALELVAESVSGVQETVVAVGVYVDGKRFNSRSVHLRSTAPAASLKQGAMVNVRVVSRGVTVEAKGKVVRVERSGQVTVQVADTGAQLTGVAMPDGSVEVKA